jgi:hypothetical protein
MRLSRRREVRLPAPPGIRSIVPARSADRHDFGGDAADRHE